MFEIDPDIRRAQTPPAALYHDAQWYRAVTERVMTRSWHLVTGDAPPSQPDAQQPWVLLPGCLDEPVLWTRDDAGVLRLLSNVCTHRGNLLVERACEARAIRCRYHGRRFAADGRMLAMPEFEGALDFPGDSDHLPTLPFASLGPLHVAGLRPEPSADAWFAPLRERLDFLPWDQARFAPDRSRDYHVRANWALYCDNYLEGFHIPFVHPALNRALDYGRYRTVLLPHGVLQLGIGEHDDDAFALPPGHPDHGERIAGFYFFSFPSTMINAYPWGLSVNAVEPLGPERCRVAYRTWVWDPARLDRGAGSGLDQVEFEDEQVVEAVARGVRSRLYDRGRYSPSRETGTHHFHRLLAAMLQR
ncbi:MAG: SRPBCC family protein [Nannocystaceae bacterium]